jgi:hypothetical protein
MSDFLSRLAGRTMGLTPSVQPLVTSMYAPRSTPAASQQSGLVPLDTDISGPTPLHGNANASLPLHGDAHASVGTGLAPVRAWATPHPFAPRDTHQAFGQPQEHSPTGLGQPQAQASTASFQPFEQPQEHFPTGDNPLTTQAELHPDIDGDSPLPLQEEHVEETHKNHPFPADGGSSSHPSHAPSQHSLGHSLASSSVTHTDSVSIPTQTTTPLRRSVPSGPPNGPEHPNESTPSNGPFPLASEFSQASIATSAPLSTQASPFSQRAGAGTNLRSYGQHNGQAYTNDTRGEQRPMGSTENNLQEEHRTLQDWASLPPTQQGATGRTGQTTTARYRNQERGNPGRTMQQSIHDDTPTREATKPSIQVTIGRIEVRATPPPPTRAPARRTTPAIMSLDDYVNQRIKGGL